MKYTKWSHEKKSVFKDIISVVIILIPALIFGIMGKAAEMGLAIVAGSITAAFLNIDRFQSDSGALTEKEMKEAVDETYIAIDNLKEISIPLIVSTLNTIIYSGRYGGLGINKRHDLKNDIEVIINKLGINDNNVKSILEDFYRVSTRDLFQYFTTEFLKGKSNYNEISDKLNNICNWKSTNYPTKENILEVLNVNENDLNELELGKLKDYLYYKQNRKLLRDISYND